MTTDLKTASLLETCDLAPEVRHFVFDVPELDRLAFEPGQYVSLHRVIGGEPLIRPYSIASPPDGNRFELCLNRVPDGPFSNFLFEMRAGEEVSFAGPLGFFRLRTPLRDSLFLASGTGIAPIRSMLHYLLRHNSAAWVRLLFGARNKESLLYRGEFEQLAAAHPNFEFHPVLSREGSDWTGRRGHVQDHLDDMRAGRTDVDVYVCGLRDMVNDVRQQLKEKGFDRRAIVYEKYN
jgi:CDP-4-dehydro-6-deoxyglucose reductase